MIETAVKEFPNFKVAGDHAASRHHGDEERLERDSLARRQVLRKPPISGASRFSTASAAATASRRGLQFGFLEFNDAQKAVEYGAAHECAGLEPRPATRAWPRARKWKNVRRRPPRGSLTATDAHR
jgi:hypothetical protein